MFNPILRIGIGVIHVINPFPLNTPGFYPNQVIDSLRIMGSQVTFLATGDPTKTLRNTGEKTPLKEATMIPTVDG